MVSNVLWLTLFGFMGGILGGMGMGGGTVLIPLLTLALGVPQKVAQLSNLVAFLPMSLVSLTLHKRNGLLGNAAMSTNNLLATTALILPALLASLGGALVAVTLSGALLKKLFASFLIVLACLKAASLMRATFGKGAVGRTGRMGTFGKKGKF
jgi:hypothetical protein